MQEFSYQLDESRMSGIRLDRSVAVEFPDQSRTRVVTLIKEGVILVNGKPSKASYLVRENDVISGSFPGITSDLVAEKMDFGVVYEDEYLLIIDKPAGLTVHPSTGRNPTGTLVNGLLHYLGASVSTGSDPLRPGIVHRLDKDTSGLMIIAKTDIAHRKLAKLFESHTIEKKYIVLLRGVLEPKSGRIEAPIGRSTRDGKRMAVSTFDGKEASTSYTVKKYLAEKYTLAEVQIHTGRTHQIRVHFSAIGYPVIGDDTYGDSILNKKFEQEFGLTRQFLHAFSLKFTHPCTKKVIEVQAGLPAELEAVLKKI